MGPHVPQTNKPCGAFFALLNIMADLIESVAGNPRLLVMYSLSGTCCAYVRSGGHPGGGGVRAGPD